MAGLIRRSGHYVFSAKLGESCSGFANISFASSTASASVFHPIT
ncbi:hypothetical protein X971_5431 (plasmid) [Agrobacterium tumefaciens LBA4213 (Ach5)]|nr:hypothetical protein X971_5431 [Agrobacterium tumefaciens LBA4213 (Ach5)]